MSDPREPRSPRCIVELYVFFAMGGDLDRLRVLLVARGRKKHELQRAVFRRTLEFDAARCDCYDYADKEKILAVIEQSKGGIAKFNMQVAAHLTTMQEIDVPEEPEPPVRARRTSPSKTPV